MDRRSARVYDQIGRGFPKPERVQQPHQVLGTAANVVSDETGPAVAGLRDLLDFAGIAPPSIPVIPVAQHLAENLRA